MHGIALRHLGQQHQLAVGHFLVMCADANGRLDRIGAHLDQKGVQVRDLSARHADDVAVVGNAGEHHAPGGVGEGRDFVGPVAAGRSFRTIPGKLDLLEFPGAVLARAQSAFDFLDAVVHVPTIPATLAGRHGCRGLPPPGGSVPTIPRSGHCRMPPRRRSASIGLPSASSTASQRLKTPMPGPMADCGMSTGEMLAF